MGKLDLTPEERERRAENMRELHREGKAGAQFGHLGGRPRKKRASEVIAQKVAEEAEEIWTNLRALAFDSDSEKIRMDTSFRLIDIEEKERKVNVEEEVRYEQLKHAELAELVIGNLFELVRNGSIDLGQIVDAEDIEDGEITGIGQGNGRVESEAEAIRAAN